MGGGVGGCKINFWFIAQELVSVEGSWVGFIDFAGVRCAVLRHTHTRTHTHTWASRAPKRFLQPAACVKKFAEMRVLTLLFFFF